MQNEVTAEDIKGTVIELVGGQFVQLMRQLGADNYVALQFESRDKQKFELIIQRIEGLTPAERAKAVDKELAELKQSLEGGFIARVDDPECETLKNVVTLNDNTRWVRLRKHNSMISDLQKCVASAIALAEELSEYAPDEDQEEAKQKLSVVRNYAGLVS